MTVTSKPLALSQYALNSESTVYTASSGVRAIIDKFSAYNGSGATATLTVKLVASGSAAAADDIIESKAIPSGDTWGFPHIVGHALEPGGLISVIASASSAIVIRASGREVT